MKRFRFRLAVPLKLRRLVEREALRTLATALQRVAAIEREHDALKRRRDAGFAALAPPPGGRLDVAALIRAHDQIRALDRALARLEAAGQRAARDLETARVEAAHRSRERKALEKLEERARREWREEELREEGRLMDEIASLRHGRRDEEGATP